jgi:hypothetical protein
LAAIKDIEPAGISHFHPEGSIAPPPRQVDPPALRMRYGLETACPRIEHEQFVGIPIAQNLHRHCRRCM